MVYLSKCFSGSHLMSGHKVGKDTCGASRHSHLTIDKHLPASSESFVDELIDGIKMQRNVGLRNIKQPKAFVCDAPGLIEVLGTEVKFIKNYIFIASFLSDDPP